MPTATLEQRKHTATMPVESRRYSAPIAVYESSDSYTLIAELPGIDEKALQLRLDNGTLTIEAPVKVDLPADAVLRYSEMRIGNYWRSVDVGDCIDPDKIEACFKNGLLVLTLHKTRSSKSRKVPIKTA